MLRSHASHHGFPAALLGPGRRQWGRVRRELVRFARRPRVRQVFWGATLGFAILVAATAGLWWRLSSGPIEIPFATSWLKGGDRGQFRRQPHRLGRRHADRARRAGAHLAALDRHRGARRRRHRGGERAQGRSRDFRRQPFRRQGAGAEPQSGRRRNGGAHRGRQQDHGVRRRRQAAAGERVAAAGRRAACRTQCQRAGAAAHGL